MQRFWIKTGSTYKEPLEAKWVKSWASWNITIMHFQNSKLSFFTNNASFGHFHQVSMNSITNCTFSKFRYNFATINNEEKSYNKRYLPLSFSKYNRDKSKVSLFLRDQRYSDAWKISTDLDAKCKGSESRQVAHRKSHWEAKWVKSWASWNITIMHFQNSKLSFFTNNASFGHFHQVSMNSITNCTFSKFQVQFGTINNEEKVTTRSISILSIFQI